MTATKQRKLSCMAFGLIVLVIICSDVSAFISTPSRASTIQSLSRTIPQDVSKFYLNMENDEKKAGETGVIELAEDSSPKQENDAKTPSFAAPFLSQSTELADGVLQPDMSDAKQARVIIYLIISLLPVLALIPLMLGSRDFIPPDALPPVQM